MNIYIQLTSAGTNTGPFSLYSDADGYTLAFETNISRNKLLSGFTSLLVPTGTAIIRVVSDGECEEQVDINVDEFTTSTTTSSTSSTTTTSTSSSTTTSTTSSSTTTTSTTGIPCLEFCFEGLYAEGDPVHPEGGAIVYINCEGVEDTEPSIFIESGIVTILAQSIISNVGCASVICPTTTTTTTEGAILQSLLIGGAVSGGGEGDASLLCGELYNSPLVDLPSVTSLRFLSSSVVPIVSDILYIDNLLTIPFNGNSEWYGGIPAFNIITNNTYQYLIKISSIGVVEDISTCVGITTTTTTLPITTTTTTTLSSELYTTRLEEVGALTYVGDALAGSSESNAVWRIKRIDETSGVVVLWADGNDNFDNIWTDYLTLIYS